LYELQRDALALKYSPQCVEMHVVVCLLEVNQQEEGLLAAPGAFTKNLL
jgi:hypothetical protein